MRTSEQITNYVYHLYGTEEIFLMEASYSISTLLKRIDPARSRILLFTDRPERVCSLPVTCESIADEIDEMKGPSGFKYRIKLCCILKCAAKYSGNIISLDCDTIINGPIEAAAGKVDKGHALMYKRERLLGRYSLFDGFQTRLPGDKQYCYGPQSCMFNAGVVGFHRENIGILETALAICDALILQGRRNNISEQFAVSEAFRISGLKILESHQVISHYYRGSAKRYMHHMLRKLASQKGLLELDRPIPYSYPRVQLFKLLEKMKIGQVLK